MTRPQGTFGQPNRRSVLAQIERTLGYVPPPVRKAKPATPVPATAPERTIPIQIVKSVPELQQVYGFLAVSEDADGREVVDLDGDVIPLSELQKTAHTCYANMSLGDSHGKVGCGRLIESLVTSPDVLKAMGVPDDIRLPRGWFTGWQVEDPAVWAKIRSGEYAGFSIGGTGLRGET